MPPPRLFLHCGLHKTGTTALQRFLLNERDAMRALGIVVPKSGRIDELGGGHHNIAWELARDRRFKAERGSLAQLIDEIADCPDDVVLSSEDFETCLSVPGWLDPLIRHPGLKGRQPVVVVYLRDQVTYAESLFVQLLPQGSGDECVATMRTILERQSLPVWEWRFQFDYGQLLRTRQAMPDVEVVFRDYATLTGGSIVPDFLGVLRPRATVMLADREVPRVNTRFPILHSLCMFHANRMLRSLTPAEMSAIWLLEQAVGSRTRMRLPQAARAAFANRFNAANRALCQASGLPPDSFAINAGDTSVPGGVCFMDRIFTFETQLAVAALAEIVPADLKPGVPATAAGEISAAAQAIIADTVANWRDQRVTAAAEAA